MPDAPAAAPDAAFVYVDGGGAFAASIDVLANDVDADEDRLTVRDALFPFEKTHETVLRVIHDREWTAGGSRKERLASHIATTTKTRNSLHKHQAGLDPRRRRAKLPCFGW